MHRKFALPALVSVPVLAVALTACGSAANAEACAAYEAAHAALDDAVVQQEAGTMSQQDVRDQFAQLPLDIAAAANLAEGEVRAAMMTSSEAAEKYEALQTEDNGMYFFLQANDVVEVCGDNGSSIAID